MKVASLLLVVLLTGCAGKAIEPSYYLIRSDHEMETRELNPSKDFSLGSVVIASYIDQPGLLIETTEGEIRSARHNLWAEPVYEGVRNQLVVEIAQAKGEDILPASLAKTALVVDIRLDQLHGTNKGTAKLVAYWWLRRGQEVVAAYVFAEEQALVADGYTALVAAEKALLTRLAKNIADTLVITDS